MTNLKIPKILGNSLGMTIMELIMAMTVSGIIGYGLMETFRSAAVTNRTANQDLEAQQVFQELDFLLNNTASCSNALKNTNTNPNGGGGGGGNGNPIQIFRPAYAAGAITQGDIFLQDPTLVPGSPAFVKYGGVNITSVRLANIRSIGGSFKKGNLNITVSKSLPNGQVITYGQQTIQKSYPMYWQDTTGDSNLLLNCSAGTSTADICSVFNGSTFNPVTGQCSLNTDRNTCLKLGGQYQAGNNPPCTYSANSQQTCDTLCGGPSCWVPAKRPSPLAVPPFPGASPHCYLAANQNLDPATYCTKWGGMWIPPCDFSAQGLECQNLGGVWDAANSTCYFPYQSEPACVALGGAWTAPNGPCVFPSDGQKICQQVLNCTWNGTTCNCPSSAGCGTANGVAVAAAPAANLCVAGWAASAVTGAGPWSWTCTNGSISNCSAPATVVVPPPLCPATNLSWTVGGTTCSSAVGATTASTNSPNLSSAAPPGSATFACSAAGTWAASPNVGATCAPGATGECFAYTALSFGGKGGACRVAPTTYVANANCTLHDYYIAPPFGWGACINQSSCQPIMTGNPMAVNCPGGVGMTAATVWTFAGIGWGLEITGHDWWGNTICSPTSYQLWPRIGFNQPNCGGWLSGLTQCYTSTSVGTYTNPTVGVPGPNNPYWSCAANFSIPNPAGPPGATFKPTLYFAPSGPSCPTTAQVCP